jgi:hypothetical protein
MVANLQRKKGQTHQDDEVRCIFIPIKQICNNNLKNILFWTSSREERTRASEVSLVGLFEVEWKTPHDNILVEFFNCKLDFEHKKCEAMMGEE